MDKQYMCKVCGDTFEGSTKTGVGLCPEHMEMHNTGFIALIAIDPDQSALQNGKVKPSQAHRTGQVIHIKRTMIDKLLEMDEKTLAEPCLYVEEEMLDQFQEIFKMEPPKDRLHESELN